jgi:hypothetical protein
MPVRFSEMNATSMRDHVVLNGMQRACLEAHVQDRRPAAVDAVVRCTEEVTQHSNTRGIPFYLCLAYLFPLPCLHHDIPLHHSIPHHTELRNATPNFVARRCAKKAMLCRECLKGNLTGRDKDFGPGKELVSEQFVMLCTVLA